MSNPRNRSPLLVHAQAQAASEGLAAFPFTADVAQGANLEDVGIVPTLAQGRVREDEFQWRVETEQLLLVLHNQAVGAFGVVAAGVALIALSGIGPGTFLVDGEVAIVNIKDGGIQVDLFEQAQIIGMIRPALVFLRTSGRTCLSAVGRCVVLAVMRDGIDEEQRQHLDSLRAQA